MRKYKLWGIYLIGLLMYFVVGCRWCIPIAAWVGVPCLLWAFDHARSKKQLVVMYLGLFAGSFVRCINIIGTPGADTAVAFLLFLLAFIPFLADRLFYHKLENKIGAFAVFLTPCVTVFVEGMMENLIGITFPLGATQIGEGLMYQTYGILGVHGVSWAIVLFGMAVRYITENPWCWYKRLRPLGLWMFGMAIVFLFGSMHQAYPVTKGDESMTVALGYSTQIAGEQRGEYLDIPYEDVIDYVERMADQAVTVNADILVFPEEAFPIEPEMEPQLKEDLGRIAREHQLWMLTPNELNGDEVRGGKLGVNQEYLFDDAGNLVETYVKHHLVPGDETGCYVVGTGPILTAEIPLKSGTKVQIASMICMDADDPGFVAQIPKETDVLFVPSWDWQGVDPFHSNLLTCRAVENDVVLVKPTYNGHSIIVDQTGRYILDNDYKLRVPDSLLVAQIPVRIDHSCMSPYHYIAKDMAVLNMLAILVMIIAGLFGKKKRKQNNNEVQR